MTNATPPPLLDTAFASLLGATKADFVHGTAHGTVVDQHGAARIDVPNLPPWPDLGTPPHEHHAVIETFVCRPGQVRATGVDAEAIDAWLPLAAVVNDAVRGTLARFGVELDGDAYLTSSVTPRGLHEGSPHVDDDLFRPAEDVGVVAIIGAQAGPTIARAPVRVPALRPDTPIVFDEVDVAGFGTGLTPHTVCGPDQLVVFPQFGQLHAGPDAARLPPGTTHRHLVVFRGRVRSGATPDRINPPPTAQRRRTSRERFRPRA